MPNQSSIPRHPGHAHEAPPSTPTPNHCEVVIAGGGPTGMMLAAELAMAGVDVVIIERRSTPGVVESRAGGLHARTLEILAQRGIVDRFLAEGRVAQVTTFGWIPVDLGDAPSRYPHGLALWQNRIEAILAQWVDELGVTTLRGREVVGLKQDHAGVRVQLEDGAELQAAYLVGCDGGRSRVRRAAGIGFPGWDATTSWLIAEVQMAEEPALGLRRDAMGIHGMGRRGDGDAVGVTLTEGQLATGESPTLADLSAGLVAVWGTDFGVHDPAWISRFTDAARQAATYRKGRVLLAGDAAHIHNPIGGQGLNTGLQDAVNLGWKLARVLRGSMPDSLLDSYHAERHPVGAQVLRNTLAQLALLRPDEHSRALHETVSELLGLDEARIRMAARMSGLDIRYDLGEGHPLLGRRMPDLDLSTDGGPRTVYSLLHAAAPVLLDLERPRAPDRSGSAPREPSSPGSVLPELPTPDTAQPGGLRRVRGRYDGTWQLPVVGEVPAPAAVLIRPDGHVAWVGDGTTYGLAGALTRWCGP